MSIKKIFRFISLESKSLKDKLLIAFALMSIIPLLSMTYFIANFIFPSTEATMFQVTAVVMFALWVAWTGYILAKEIILPVVNLALETKLISEGRYDTEILLKRDDELGDIASAVNTMTGKIRGYLGELQAYSRETVSLNARIHRKVLTLTNLIKLGDLISTGTRFEEMSRFVSEQLARELDGGFCGIFIKEQTGRYTERALADNSGKKISGSGIIPELSNVERLFVTHEYLSVDSRPLAKSWQKEIREKLGLMNAILFPMKAQANVIGVILFGNFEREVKFGDEDVEVLRAFEKELVLGYQSAQVLERVKSLEIVDSLTGLYTFSYLEDQLEDEINRSIYYQRPCSLIVLRLDNYEEYLEQYGKSKAVQILKEVGNKLSEFLPPVDKVARSDKNEFGILLPEKNKKESMEIAEDLRRKIEELGIALKGERKLAVTAGVGENPIDGTTAKDIIAHARKYIEEAKKAKG